MMKTRHQTKVACSAEATRQSIGSCHPQRILLLQNYILHRFLVQNVECRASSHQVNNALRRRVVIIQSEKLSPLGLHLAQKNPWDKILNENRWYCVQDNAKFYIQRSTPRHSHRTTRERLELPPYFRKKARSGKGLAPLYVSA